MASGNCSGEHVNVLAVVTYYYVAVRLGGARRFGAHRGRRGRGIVASRPPIAC